MKDSLSDRMKEYEYQTTGSKLISGLPVVARLDGRSFSKFTKGLEKPYDERLRKLMVRTTEYLVKQTNANCGYHQSDEISLLWYTEDYNSQMIFNNKIFKLTSILASMATGFFVKNLPHYIPEKDKYIPTFDTRVYNVPSLLEATNTFLWRQMDATRNSIQSSARSIFSHEECKFKNMSQLQDMLMSKGVNWNDYPDAFKRGSFIMRRKVNRLYNADEIEKLPRKHNAVINKNLKVERWEYVECSLLPLNQIENIVDVICWGKDYITKKESDQD